MQFLKTCFLNGLFIKIFCVISHGQDSIPGTYQDDHTQLKLSCDGSFSITYRIENDTLTSFGKWATFKKRLAFSIDSSRSTISSWKPKEFSLERKGDILYGSRITRAQYRISKRLSKNMCFRVPVEPFSAYKTKRSKLNKLSSYDCSPSTGMLRKPG
jgi:hypothetical protein